MGQFYTPKDKNASLKKLIAIPIAQYTADIATAAGINMSNYFNHINVLVFIGTLTAASAVNKMTFKVTQSATLAGTYSDAISNQYAQNNPVDATYWDKIIDDAGEADSIVGFNFQLHPDYPFIKVEAIEGGAFDGTFGAFILVEQRLP
jgi:hypothetical protein